MQGMHLTVLSHQCVLLEPGLSLNPAEPEQYAADIITFLQKNQCQRLIYDLKNIVLIDHTYYHWLCYLNNLCKLNNTMMVVINMKPSAAFGLSQFIDAMPEFKTALNVEAARNL
jgi:hypothetical protein